MDDAARRDAAELVTRESHYLDARDWDAWLALYAEDAEYWAPAWKGDDNLADDPQSEISLIYYASRVGLEERVHRVRSGMSVTTMPLPRTAHMLGNFIVSDLGEGGVEVHSTWNAHSYDPYSTRQHVLFGRYEHRLRPGPSGFAIVRKKIILMNDRIPSVVDFYSL